MRGSTVWAIAVIALGMIGGVVVLSALNKDNVALIGVVAAIISSVVGPMLVKQDVQRVESKVDQVASNVNGHLTALTHKIPDASTPSEETPQ